MYVQGDRLRTVYKTREYGVWVLGVTRGLTQPEMTVDSFPFVFVVGEHVIKVNDNVKLA